MNSASGTHDTTAVNVASAQPSATQTPERTAKISSVRSPKMPPWLCPPCAPGAWS